jgi:hypothetical protein
MKKPFLFSLALIGWLAAGCSSTPTRVDEGPIRAATFSFVAKTPSRAPDYAAAQEQIDAMIQDAISRNLAARGLRRVASGGDVTVAYLLIIGNNASTEMVNTYFGYGRDASALQDQAHKGYTRNKNPNYFEAGTLLVDLIDTQSYKLLKRSYVVRPLLKNPTAEARAEHIQEAVDAVLSDLRLAR